MAFDRLLVAQAEVAHLTLMTTDKTLAQSGSFVKRYCVWWADEWVGDGLMKRFALRARNVTMAGATATHLMEKTSAGRTPMPSAAHIA